MLIWDSNSAICLDKHVDAWVSFARGCLTNMLIWGVHSVCVSLQKTLIRVSRLLKDVYRKCRYWRLICSGMPNENWAALGHFNKWNQRGPCALNLREKWKGQALICFRILNENLGMRLQLQQDFERNCWYWNMVCSRISVGNAELGFEMLTDFVEEVGRSGPHLLQDF